MSTESQPTPQPSKPAPGTTVVELPQPTNPDRVNASARPTGTPPIITFQANPAKPPAPPQ